VTDHPGRASPDDSRALLCIRPSQLSRLGPPPLDLKESNIKKFNGSPSRLG
jgi:hypothetical protein